MIKAYDKFSDRKTVHLWKALPDGWFPACSSSNAGILLRSSLSEHGDGHRMCKRCQVLEAGVQHERQVSALLRKQAE